MIWSQIYFCAICAVYLFFYFLNLEYALSNFDYIYRILISPKAWYWQLSLQNSSLKHFVFVGQPMAIRSPQLLLDFSIVFQLKFLGEIRSCWLFSVWASLFISVFKYICNSSWTELLFESSVKCSFLSLQCFLGTLLRKGCSPGVDTPGSIHSLFSTVLKLHLYFIPTSRETNLN